MILKLVFTFKKTGGGGSKEGRGGRGRVIHSVLLAGVENESGAAAIYNIY